MSAWRDRSAYASPPLSSRPSDETEVIRRQVKAELEKQAMADSALRRDFDQMRQQHELLRQELQTYRSAAQPVQPIVAAMPGVHDRGSPAFQTQGSPQGSAAFQKLQNSPAFLRLVGTTNDHQQEWQVTRDRQQEWQVKDRKEVADIQNSLQEWQAKARLSFAAVDMLALQASKLAEENTQNKEEKILTTGLRRFASPDAEYKAAFSDGDGSLGSTHASDREGHLLFLMEKQVKTLDMIQMQVEGSVQGSVQGITEQQLQRLEESCKRQIDEAFRAGAPHTEPYQSKTMPLPEPTSAAMAPVTTDATKEIMQTDDDEESAGELSFANTTRPPTHEEFMTSKAAKESKTGIDFMLHSTMWEMSQIEKAETSHSWYTLAFDRATAKKSDIHERIGQLGLGHLVPHIRPENVLVQLVDMTWFHMLTVLAIVANTFFTGIKADQTVQAIIKSPPETLPPWWDSVDLGFTIYFGAEVVLRLLAFRAFFFVEKGQAFWNILDLTVSVISVAASNFDIVFLRLLRIIRLARLIKVIAQAKALAQLRNLLFAVISCLEPLFWAVAFLAMTMALFALLILQCISSSIQTLEEDLILNHEVRTYFGGFQGCVRTLSICVLGPDWIEPHDTLSALGIFSAVVMPLFIMFVNIGVMNIVINVFGDASGNSKDRHSIADAEIDAVTGFAAEMAELASEAVDKDGVLEWDKFKEFFNNEDVQAYLNYHGLDSSHVQLLYHLLDNSGDDNVDIREFVIGMLRLKGVSKRLDQQVELHALKTLVKDVQLIRHQVQKVSEQHARQLHHM